MDMKKDVASRDGNPLPRWKLRYLSLPKTKEMNYPIPANQS
jgi:hypothetical protein